MCTCVYGMYDTCACVYIDLQAINGSSTTALPLIFCERPCFETRTQNLAGLAENQDTYRLTPGSSITDVPEFSEAW